MKKASKYDKSRIMREAHELYRLRKPNGYTFGSCLKYAWDDAKVRAKIQEMKVQQIAETKAREDARMARMREEAAKENARVRAEMERLGVDAYTYRMMHEYGRPGVYYGD